MNNKLKREDIINQLQYVDVDKEKHKSVLIKSINDMYIEIELYKYALTSDNKEVVEYAKEELSREYIRDVDYRVKMALNRYGLDIEDGKVFKIKVDDRLPF